MDSKSINSGQGILKNNSRPQCPSICFLYLTFLFREPFDHLHLNLSGGHTTEYFVKRKKQSKEIQGLVI